LGENAKIKGHAKELVQAGRSMAILKGHKYQLAILLHGRCWIPINTMGFIFHIN
jgi:hypothetical protein